jgi:hypothetical protein
MPKSKIHSPAVGTLLKYDAILHLSGSRLLWSQLWLLEWFFIDGILSRSTILSERDSAAMKKVTFSAFSVPQAKRVV